jgi:beta-lactamase class A
MRASGVWLLAALGVAGGPRPGLAQRDALAERLAERVSASGAKVGLFFRTLDGRDSLSLEADLRFHAASTMKLPVMIQVFRDADSGRVRLSDRIAVRRTFRSIMDGSAYDLDPADDSDSSLYARVGGQAALRELVELMITRSSNLE